jgi:hypothetical protein
MPRVRRTVAMLGAVATAATATIVTATPAQAQGTSGDSALRAVRGQEITASQRPLQELLADASRRNRLPDDLVSYRTKVETEITMLLRREEGAEAVAAVEQVASTLRWNRTGAYDQRVVGYRSQQVGANLSMLSLFQTGWLQPVLYGNRLRGARRATGSGVARTTGRPNARVGTRPDGADTLPAVHPLAADREQFYRYSGGDTIVTMRAGDQVIPIAHVRVEPREGTTRDVVLFDGEMDLDASRGTLVRLRGYFVRPNAPRRRIGGALGDAVAFIEYENAQRLGSYWLPARQRIELQATLPMIGDGRAVIRIVSRFAEMQVNDTVLDAETLARADSLRLLARRRLTYASGDSLSRFGAWLADLGTMSTGLHADDFEDIAPDRWRRTGAPRLDFSAPRAADVFHFNRVEGAFTGAGLKWALRDRAPGVVVRANAGYAWSEGTVRGRLAVERTRGATTVEAHGGRSLDITNDFRVPFDSGNTFSALFGSLDAYDYVSRSGASASVTRRLPARAMLLRAEFGVHDDRYRPSSHVRSPFGGAAYRPNRGVDAGSYVRSAVMMEWHPDVSAEFVKPGVGARVSYERGDGTLAWERAELRVNGRRPWGPVVAVARADVGQVWGGRIPPQQLFELGKYQNLPGYADKEFAGSRSAVVRGSLQYTGPFLRNPVRLGRQLWLPAIAPGLSVGIQGGWADAPTDAARTAIDRLAVVDVQSLAQYAPVARPTERVRGSVTAGLRFFGGALFVGGTRPVDSAGPWKTLVGFGQAW